MGFYREQILPRLIDKACGNAAVGVHRRAAVEGAVGRVVEIGFGSGLNLPHYPDSVTEVLAVEPSLTAQKLAADRVAAVAFPVSFVGLDGQQLPLDDASCDTAVCTFTLCTVPDPTAALDELRRVLKPGGRFHFLEHGYADDPSVQKWQHRLDGLQSRLFDGCHLTRRPTDLAEAAGFRVVRSESRFERGPKPLSWFTTAVVARD